MSYLLVLQDTHETAEKFYDIHCIKPDEVQHDMNQLISILQRGRGGAQGVE